MSNKYDQYVIAVHILFAIVIGSIFAAFHEDLFPITTGSFNFKSALIFTAFATILLSWVGYNKRVEKTGHKSGILFTLDFVIIYFYFQLVYSINVSFSLYVLSMALIFSSYLVWYPIKYFFDHKITLNKKYVAQLVILPITLAILLFFYFGFNDGVIMQDIDLGTNSTDVILKEEFPTSEPRWYLLLLLVVLLIPFRIPDLWPDKMEKKKMNNDESFMQKAIEESKQGLSKGGIPIGSVLVKGNQIIGKGHNRRIQDNNPMAHGEIECLINAGRIGNYTDATLYSTLMPCYLCAGAVIQFGIKRVVVGESKNFTGARDLMESHGVEVIDLNSNECFEIMKSFIEKNPDIWNEDIGLK